MQEIGTNHQFDTQMLGILVFFEKAFEPGERMVDPADDGIAIKSCFLYLKLSPPAVVAHEVHRHERPVFLRFVLIKYPAANMIMTIGEDVGLNPDGLAR